ncbi:MAG: hypothetical protein PHD04_04910 [Candidatus Pacebacteria bacterium]|nr:hypothetical protein [Candidatus Paceibacterota bacterium]
MLFGLGSGLGLPTIVVSSTLFSTPAPRGSVVGYVRLPTDPIGTTTVTLTNIIDGSALQIESQDGSTTFHNSVVAGTSKVVTLQVYASGSPLNDLRIKVRKGSVAPYYQPYETMLTAVVGSASVYVSQIPD